MHFCSEEARALITAIQHPDLMLAHALAYLKRLWITLKNLCRRCPKHCRPCELPIPRKPRPTYNHTRADGPYDPCPECFNLMNASELAALARDREAEELY